MSKKTWFYSEALILELFNAVTTLHFTTRRDDTGSCLKWYIINALSNVRYHKKLVLSSGKCSKNIFYAFFSSLNDENPFGTWMEMLFNICRCNRWFKPNGTWQSITTFTVLNKRRWHNHAACFYARGMSYCPISYYSDNDMRQPLKNSIFIKSIN